MNEANSQLQITTVHMSKRAYLMNKSLFILHLRKKGDAEESEKFVPLLCPSQGGLSFLPPILCLEVLSHQSKCSNYQQSHIIYFFLCLHRCIGKKILWYPKQ